MVACMHVCSVAQLCPTLCDPMDYHLPGSSVHGVFFFLIGKNTGVFCHFLLQEISPPRDRTCISCISCIGWQILYHHATWEYKLLLLMFSH